MSNTKMENTRNQFQLYLTNELVRMKDDTYQLVELLGKGGGFIIGKDVKEVLKHYNAIATIALRMFEFTRDADVVSDAPEETVKLLIKISQEEYSKWLNQYIDVDVDKIGKLVGESLETVFNINDMLKELEDQLFGSIVLILDTYGLDCDFSIFDIYNQRGKIEHEKPQESKQGELFEKPEKEVADYDDSMFKRVEDKKDQDGDIPF